MFPSEPEETVTVGPRAAAISMPGPVGGVVPAPGQPARVDAEPEAVQRATQPGPEHSSEAQTIRRCEVCGNEYDKCIEVVLAGRSHVFDCFECAMHALAPTCAHCGCRIVGHGAEHGAELYCSAHCGRSRGAENLADRT